MRRSGFLALLAPLLLAGCGWVGVADRTQKPDGFLLHGYVSVPGPPVDAPAGEPCTSTAPDIFAGAEVKIADDRGKVIASGSLGDGVLAAGSLCNFPFEIANVPGASSQVVVLVGKQPSAPFDTGGLREGRPAVIKVTASTSPS